MTYLIGLSGPPRSGKDTLGAAIATLADVRYGQRAAVLACSMPMRLTVYTMLGIDYTVEHYEQFKDVPMPELGGGTIRSAMIALSEEHVKPRYGKGFWATSVLAKIDRLPEPPKLVVITDMGFAEEVDVFISRFGRANCLWPQLKRPGHDFSRDSRNYVGDPERMVGLDNPGLDLDFFVAAATFLGECMDHLGWKLTNDS